MIEWIYLLSRNGEILVSRQQYAEKKYEEINNMEYFEKIYNIKINKYMANLLYLQFVGVHE